MSDKKLAVVSDQICGGFGGAESITFAAIDLFPGSPLYTTIYNEDIIPDKYKNVDIRNTFIAKLPFAQKIYKAYFPLMPMAIEYLNLQEYDVIFSSHHCVAKGIISNPDSTHICYCHSPARYIWDMLWTYSDLNGYRSKKLLINALSHYIRMWDVTSAQRVDHFLANSNYTARRIKKFWGRDSEVLFPPVNTDKFSHESSGDYYFMLGRLVAYKGFELAIEAFNESGKKLIIAGDGVEFEKLKSIAKPNVQLLGRVSDEKLKELMNNCKGFVFPGKEDFGIVMVEAQAAGKPVIALNGGGAKDIVLNNETGILFDKPNTESINNAVKQLESMNWNHSAIADYSKKFDQAAFKQRLNYILTNAEEFKLENNLSVFSKDIEESAMKVSQVAKTLNHAKQNR